MADTSTTTTKRKRSQSHEKEEHEENGKDKKNCVQAEEERDEEGGEGEEEGEKITSTNWIHVLEEAVRNRKALRRARIKARAQKWFKKLLRDMEQDKEGIIASVEQGQTHIVLSQDRIWVSVLPNIKKQKEGEEKEENEKRKGAKEDIKNLIEEEDAMEIFGDLIAGHFGVSFHVQVDVHDTQCLDKRGINSRNRFLNITLVP